MFKIKYLIIFLATVLCVTQASWASNLLDEKFDGYYENIITLQSNHLDHANFEIYSGQWHIMPSDDDKIYIKIFANNKSLEKLSFNVKSGVFSVKDHHKHTCKAYATYYEVSIKMPYKTTIIMKTLSRDSNISNWLGFLDIKAHADARVKLINVSHNLKLETVEQSRVDINDSQNIDKIECLMTGYSSINCQNSSIKYVRLIVSEVANFKMHGKFDLLHITAKGVSKVSFDKDSYATCSSLWTCASDQSDIQINADYKSAVTNASNESKVSVRKIFDILTKQVSDNANVNIVFE